MANHNFQIVLRAQREVDQAMEDHLFEAGCDDALLTSREGVVFLDFDREAAEFSAAVASAIKDVQSAGYEVLRVEPDDFVNQAQIAERSGRTRASIKQLVSGERGPGDFPAPISGTSEARFWRWSEVSTWMARLETNPLDPVRAQNAQVIEFVNARLRVASPVKPGAAQERLLSAAVRPSKAPKARPPDRTPSSHTTVEKRPSRKP